MIGRAGALFIVIAMTTLIVAVPAALAANGASVVDDADVAAPGSCKVESWAAFGESGDFIGSVGPACVFSLIQPVEIGGQVLRSRLDGEWGTAATVKAKANIIPSGPGAVGFGIAGGLGFDLITSEHSTTFVYLPITLALHDALKINLNAGWLHERPVDQHWLTYGAELEWILTKPVTVIAEIFGQTGHAATPSTVMEPRFQAGLRFTPVEAVDFDIFYGRNITGEGHHWITFGINVRFDAPVLARR